MTTGKFHLVSQKWVEESTKAHIKGNVLLGSGYGYQWWRGQTFMNNRTIEVFYAAGKGGQYIFVCPSLDLITAFTSKPGNDAFGEFRPQTSMVKYVIPAALSPAPARKILKLDSKIVDKIVGEYEFKKLSLPLSIFRKGDILFFETPDGEIGELFPETETQFCGTSKKIGDFRINCFKNEKEEIAFFNAQVGFGIVRRMPLLMSRVGTTRNRLESSKISSRHRLLKKDMRSVFKLEQ
jgi:hypothetical protein